jgi:transposase
MSYIQIQPGGKANAKGAKYVNLAWNEWDSERKRSLQRRLYVGRLTPCGREVILNKRFSGGKEMRLPLEEFESRAGDKEAFEQWLYALGLPEIEADSVVRVEICGDAWLMLNLARSSGLQEELEALFGRRDAGALLGLAAHQLITGHALYRAESWLSERELPESWKSSLVSDSNVYGFISDMGRDIARREEFFEHWIERHKGEESLIYDTTSISTYSAALELAEWGYNRDGEKLPQVNFSLAASVLGMPLFYRLLPGSVPDVSTLSTTLKIARDYGLEKLTLSLDRGFYSAANLRDLLALDCGFVIGAPWTVSQAKELFKLNRNKLKTLKYAFTYRGSPLRYMKADWHHDETLLNAHLFFNPERHAEQTLRFEKRLFELLSLADKESFATSFEARKWLTENAKWHATCFDVKHDDDRIRIVMKPNRATAVTARAGYTLVLTHGREDAAETRELVLDAYRGRDTVEKLFDALKTEHAQYRLRTGNEDSAQGRLFIAFLALILRAELYRKMRETNLGKSMTQAALFDELAKHKVLTTAKGNRIPLEVTKKQRVILEKLNIPPIS